MKTRERKNVEVEWTKSITTYRDTMVTKKEKDEKFPNSKIAK